MRALVDRLAPLAIVALAIVIAVIRFLAIDATSDSASDTLRPWLIEVAVIAVVTVMSIAVVRRLSGSGRKP